MNRSRRLSLCHVIELDDVGMRMSGCESLQSLGDGDRISRVYSRHALRFFVTSELYMITDYPLVFYRLPQMVLDRALHGALDRGRGCLLVFDVPEVDVCVSSNFRSFSFLWRP